MNLKDQKRWDRIAKMYAAGLSPTEMAHAGRMKRCTVMRLITTRREEIKMAHQNS